MAYSSSSAATKMKQMTLTAFGFTTSVRHRGKTVPVAILTEVPMKEKELKCEFCK